MSVLPDLMASPRPETLSATGFALDATTESVYQTVLEHPGVGAATLAELMAQSEVTVRFAVEHLASLGLVTRVNGGEGWTAIEPEVGLAALLARQQGELARHQQQVEDSRLTVARLLASVGRRQRQDTGGVEWVVGGPTVRARTAELAAGCAEECLSMRAATDPGTAGTLDENLLARGVSTRSIVLDSARNDRQAMAALVREAEAGAEIRTLPVLPAQVRVFDQRHAVVAVDNLTGVAGELVVSCDAVVGSYVTLFTKLWAEAQPLRPGPRSRRGDSLSPQEVHVLKLWAQGHTDASAARRMAVSLRTVRRLSDRLTERLGTRSRFQLGAVAITRNLIDPAEIL